MSAATPASIKTTPASFIVLCCPLSSFTERGGLSLLKSVPRGGGYLRRCKKKPASRFLENRAHAGSWCLAYMARTRFAAGRSEEKVGCWSEKQELLMRVCRRVLALGFPFPVSFALPLRFTLGFAFCFARSIFRIAPGLLQFALHLLRSAFHLRIGVACPLANLALRAPCGIVHCALHSVLIHCVHLRGLASSFLYGGAQFKVRTTLQTPPVKNSLLRRLDYRSAAAN